MPTDSISYLLPLALLVTAVVAAKRLVPFLMCLRLRCRTPLRTPAPREAMPFHTRQVLDSAAIEVQRQGFVYVRSEAAQPDDLADPRDLVHYDLYWHEEQATLALVSQANPATGKVTRVEFLTAFGNGPTLLTINRERWSLLPPPNGLDVVDSYCDDLQGQWHCHVNALDAHPESANRVTGLAEAQHRGQAWQTRLHLKRLRELGLAEEEQGDAWRLTPKGAWLLSGLHVSKPAEARRALARPYKHDPAPNPQAARLAEMEFIATALARADQPSPVWIRATLAVVTLILSALFMGGHFGAIQALALLAVLLLHELGHLAAMRVFGYRNLTVFFIPFLGALASGHKPRATALQESIVLLAGPVPGLMLALAAMQIPSEAMPLPLAEFVRACVQFSLVLNLFNLLPFSILDGGRLFELAVLARFPYARFIFAVVGVAVGAAFALWSHQVLFGALMLLLATTLPLQLQVARMVAGIHRRMGAAAIRPMAAKAAIVAMGLEFSRRGYGTDGLRGWSRRMKVAHLSYPRLLQAAPGLALSLGVLAVHALMFVLPLAYTVTHVIRSDGVPLWQPTAAELRDLEREVAVRRDDGHEAYMSHYASISDPQARWELLHDGRRREFNGYLPEAAWREQEIASLLLQLPADHLGRLEHLLKESHRGGVATRLMETRLEAIEALTEGGTRAGGAFDDERLRMLIGLYTSLAQDGPQDVRRRLAPSIEALWHELGAPGHLNADQRAYVAAARVHLAVANDNRIDGETWVQRYRSDRGSSTDSFPDLVEAWMQLDLQNPKDALAIAQRALDEQSNSQGVELAWATREWHSVAGWAYMAQGDPRVADLHFRDALAERASRVNRVLDSTPWWYRWVGPKNDVTIATREWLTSEMLDHLAALDGYDAQEATRVRDEARRAFAQLSHNKPALRSLAQPWGKARKAAHSKLWEELTVSEAAEARSRTPPQ